MNWSTEKVLMQIKKTQFTPLRVECMYYVFEYCNGLYLSTLFVFVTLLLKYLEQVCFDWTHYCGNN